MPTIVNYHIEEDTVWTAEGNPYYICLTPQEETPIVKTGATLTIETGTVIHLGFGSLEESSDFLSPLLTIEGTINASGATFTSHISGQYWESLLFKSGSKGTFYDCTLEYGGLGELYQGMLQIGADQSSISENTSIEVLISESTVRNALWDGIHFSPQAFGSLTVASVHFSNLASAVHVINSSSPQSIVNISDSQIESCQNHGLVVNGAPASMSNCTVTGSNYGLLLTASNSKVDRCTFISNSHHGVIANNSAPTITNCLMAKNGGSGLTLNSASADLQNSTVADNLGSITMDFGINCINSTLFIRNCIIYGNNNGDILNSDSSIVVNYSNVGGQGITPGIGNINENPLFADPANGNYYLQSKAGRWNRDTDTWVNDANHSPCIDMGDPDSQYLDEPQPNGGRVNMGFEGNTAHAAKAIAAPQYLGVQVISDRRSALLRFNEEIYNNTPDLPTLKAGVLFAADGVNFQPLQPDDSVEISNEALMVRLHQEMRNDANRFRLNQELLKSKRDIVLTMPVMTEQIALQNPERVYALRRVMPETATARRVDVVRDDFAVLRSDRMAMFSRNGIDWETVGPAPVRMNSVAYGNGTYVAVGDEGFIYTSSDRRNWNRVPQVTTRALTSVISSRGMFVAVGEAGTILTSAEGATWTEVQSTPQVTLNRVVASPTEFIAVGDNGAIMKSATAAEWAVEPPLTSLPLNDIAVSPDTMVAVGAQGTVLTASRTRAWRKEAAPTSSDLRAVAYGNGRFVTAGSIFTSADGSAWAEATVSVGDPLFGVAFANNTFLLGGANGVLLQSGPIFLQALMRGVPF
ncbi:MAG: hypothetical protein N2484_00130 [Clostridia bacterium]|nr:hypothetical protein [Clostridia bacterium]